MRPSAARTAITMTAAIPWTKKPARYILTLYMLASFLLSLPYLSQPLIGDPDAYGRVLQAWIPLQKGDFWQTSFASEWLPFHGYILRMGLILWPDFFYTPQWVTFIISLPGIPLFYLYCRGILSQNHSLIAAFLFTVFPLRYIISTQPLTEGMLIPLLLPAITALTTRRLRHWLSGGIIGLSLAMGIRYEAWYLLPFLWITILTRVRRPMLKAAAILTSIVVPAFWIITTGFATNEWLSFLFRRAHLAGPAMQPLVYQPYPAFHAVASALLSVVPAPILVLAIAGTFVMLRGKRGERCTAAMLPWFYLAVLYGLVLFGAMEWITQRFFLLAAILLIPPLIYGATSLYRLNRIIFWILIAVLMPMIPSYTAGQHDKLTFRALLGNTPQEKYQAAQEVIGYVNMHKEHRFRYILPGNNADFVTMISYFTQSDMFMTAYAPDLINNPTHIILEKKPGENTTPPKLTVMDNEYFSVYLANRESER